MEEALERSVRFFALYNFGGNQLLWCGWSDACILSLLVMFRTKEEKKKWNKDVKNIVLVLCRSPAGGQSCRVFTALLCLSRRMNFITTFPFYFLFRDVPGALKWCLGYAEHLNALLTFHYYSSACPRTNMQMQPTLNLTKGQQAVREM